MILTLIVNNVGCNFLLFDDRIFGPLIDFLSNFNLFYLLYHITDTCTPLDNPLTIQAY